MADKRKANEGIQQYYVTKIEELQVHGRMWSDGVEV